MTNKRPVMAKFRKLPVMVEATQWLKAGDIVCRYNNSDVLDTTICRHCGSQMHVHGWIDTLEGGHIVCPGDWIITGVKGERYPCKPDIFAMTYEEVKDGE